MKSHLPTEFAPAKVNLTLHVTGKRADGYHLLDSLVVFAEVGDWITADIDGPLSLSISGPMAEGLTVGPDNLVLRAAQSIGVGARLMLEKHLPVSSGIGGGSSDAAATLRLLTRLAGVDMPEAKAVVGLGADVPVCLGARPVRMRGVGEVLGPVGNLPKSWLVLVNPRIPLSTKDVFGALETVDNPPMTENWPQMHTPDDLAEFLSINRNDLEPAAMSVLPEIRLVKAVLAAQTGCLIERMSGSGATCYGLFATNYRANMAANAIREAHPDWWVVAAQML